jgi:hypothetical protein
MQVQRTASAGPHLLPVPGAIQDLHQSLQHQVIIPNYKIKQKWAQDPTDPPVPKPIFVLYRPIFSLIWKGTKSLNRFKLLVLKAKYTLQRLNLFKVLKLCPFIYSNWWILTIAPSVEIYSYEGNCVLCRFTAPKWRFLK